MLDFPCASRARAHAIRYILCDLDAKWGEKASKDKAGRGQRVRRGALGSSWMTVFGNPMSPPFGTHGYFTLSPCVCCVLLFKKKNRFIALCEFKMVDMEVNEEANKSIQNLFCKTQQGLNSSTSRTGLMWTCAEDIFICDAAVFLCVPHSSGVVAHKNKQQRGWCSEGCRVNKSALDGTCHTGKLQKTTKPPADNPTPRCPSASKYSLGPCDCSWGLNVKQGG